MTPRTQWERRIEEYSSTAERQTAVPPPALEETLTAIIRDILATDYADRLAPVVSMGITIHVMHPSDVERWDESRPSLTFTAFHGGRMDVIYTPDGENDAVDLRGVPVSVATPRIMELLDELARETGA